MAFSFTIGRRVVFWLIRWANDSFRSEYAVVTMILVIAIVMAVVTDMIGVHTVLGAFVAGILIGESPILSGHIEGQLRGVITALFMPVFFGVAGLSADLTVLADPTLALLTAGLVAVASLGKFSGAFAGGKVAGLSWSEAVAVGCGMNARGSTEVIVATIGLSMGILSQNLFTMVVTMAVVTTLAMPPMLRWALGRLPLGEEERQRLEREELDQRGFVPKLERLLVAVDDSATGRFTAYLAGLIGGSSGMPTTVLHVGPVKGKDIGGKHLEPIKKGAKASAAAVKREEDHPVEKVDVTAGPYGPVTNEVVAEEARKGYGMLFVGLQRALTPKGAFTRKFAATASAFDGPLCLVMKGAGGSRALPSLESGETILVPVNGTEVSRRAAELALAIARPYQATIEALYVARRHNGSATSFSHRREEAVLKDIVDLAKRYDVPIRTTIKTRPAADKAICVQAEKGAAMIVMGVARRPGSELFFGETATAVLSNCPGPIVLLAGERVHLDDAQQEARRSKETASIESDEKVLEGGEKAPS
jgi:nucleotide-binding universal stress UspA family protein